MSSQGPNRVWRSAGRRVPLALRIPTKYCGRRLAVYSLQEEEANAKPLLETVECLSSLHAGGQSKTILGVTDLAETLPYPGVPAPYGRACAAAPWPPAPAVPGSAAQSPAALEQCGRASAPNGHAVLALGTFRWRPASPFPAEKSMLPAAARRRFKSQPLRGRGRERSAPPGAGRLHAGRSMRGGPPSRIESVPVRPRPTARAAL